MEAQTVQKKLKPTVMPGKSRGRHYEGQHANVQSILHGSRIQPKLRVGQPNDKYEQEADQVAEQVMRMPAPQPSSSVSGLPLTNGTKPGIIQRTCAACTKDEDLIQAKTTNGVTPEITPAIGTGIQSLQSGGQPLSKSERSFFEPRIGADFSDVRVHNDMRAARVAQSINARAFTHGHNVVFGAGEYSSGSDSGKRLLAHELTHVVQQGGSHLQQATTLLGNNMELKKPIESDPIDFAGAKRIQRADLNIKDESFAGTLGANDRKATKSCNITCGGNAFGTLHSMGLFYHANRGTPSSTSSASTSGVGTSLHFIKGASTTRAGGACHCTDHKIIQVLKTSHAIGTRGTSYVDNRAGSTPFYGDHYRSGTGRHAIPSGYPDAGDRVTTTRSIYDRPQRGTRGRSGQNIKWEAEACVACVKTGKDKILGCATYGFERRWNAGASRHDNVRGIGPGCRSAPSSHFQSTLNSDTSTSSYQWEL